jgi:hypothetical protein
MTIVQSLVCAGILFMLGNLPFADAASPIEEWLIVPGKSIGSVRIGMDISDARTIMARYGRVESQSATGGLAAFYCSSPAPKGVCISDVMVYGVGRVNHTPGRVAWVNTEDERFHTTDGLRVRTPSFNWLQAYGKPTVDELDQAHQNAYYKLEWHALGVAILTTNPSRNGPAGAVGVFTPIR